MAKLSGADKAMAKLRGLNSRSAKKRVSSAVYVAADMLRVEAALSISEGSVSGKNHVPSRAGEPPNFDSGHLAGSIETREVAEFECEVSAALKIQGMSAQEAQGALLQLGQALRGGKIQAEEYNSLLDGLYPLLEAAASGSERFGGSVAKLTAAQRWSSPSFRSMRAAR